MRQVTESHSSAIIMSISKKKKKKKKKKKELKLSSFQDGNQKGNIPIGILSFEVANAMSKAVHLYKSLSTSEMSNLRCEVLNCHAVKMLISSDEEYLLELAATEKLDELNRIASVVSRLGKRCSEQALFGFEHVYSDLLGGRIEVGNLGFLLKDMEGTVKKMERYVSSSANLYGELGVLNELEQGVKKFQSAQQQHQPHEETRRFFEQKLEWQRHDVKHLRESSLWNQPYNKVVGLMARAVCTLYARIVLVFGESALALTTMVPEEQSSRFSRQMAVVASRRHQQQQQPPVVVDAAGVRQLPGRRQSLGLARDASFGCGSHPGRLFMDCLSLSSSSDLDHHDVYKLENESSRRSTLGTASPASFGGGGGGGRRRGGGGRMRFGPKSTVLTQAPPSSVGGSALALHYANIIIIIEKLLQHPHLVGEDARDDLYQMLPLSVRKSLRKNLRSCAKTLAIYDAPLAHDWRERLENILSWLAPMAHNMIRWQTDHNFEQHRVVLRSTVLLLQTIYFADREKTEMAIAELLLGLNYICRYEQQQSALLDCTSSIDLDDAPPIGDCSSTADIFLNSFLFRRGRHISHSLHCT